MAMCLLPDRVYIHLKYWKRMRKKLNLKNPQTYTEKLQWLKLYDRNPQYSVLVDKYDVKEYVARRVGKQYIIPTLGIYDSFDEIDFDRLPDRFVIKCTHDSGGLVICRNKANLNLEETQNYIESRRNSNYYLHNREWPYKSLKPRILVEQYMENSGAQDESGELTDYKFFAFDGVTRAMFVATDRSSETEETKFDFYDIDFNHLDLRNGHPNAGKQIAKPKSFDKMIELANELSKGLPQARIDFYEVNGQVYFGEITLFHWGGFTAFEPEEWDKTFGDWIRLPECRQKDS